MNRYYFVSTAIPPLALGSKPEISFKELREVLELNVTARDLHRLNRLLEPIDLYNVKSLWLDLPLDDRGTLSAWDLAEALLVRTPLPLYLAYFLEQYESTADRLRYFPSLYAALYRQEEKGFLGKYFLLEREIRLVLTALRAKRANRDIVKELQFEDPLDPLVFQILSQKDAPEYEPPSEYAELKTLFFDNLLEPAKLALGLLKYRFNKIEAMEENEYFTMDQILGYAARLLIVESWDHLDKEKGNMALEELSRYG